MPLSGATASSTSGRQLEALRDRVRRLGIGRGDLDSEGGDSAPIIRSDDDEKRYHDSAVVDIDAILDGEAVGEDVLSILRSAVNEIKNDSASFADAAEETGGKLRPTPFSRRRRAAKKTSSKRSRAKSKPRRRRRRGRRAASSSSPRKKSDDEDVLLLSETDSFLDALDREDDASMHKSIVNEAEETENRIAAKSSSSAKQMWSISPSSGKRRRATDLFKRMLANSDTDDYNDDDDDDIVFAQGMDSSIDGGTSADDLNARRKKSRCRTRRSRSASRRPSSAKKQRSSTPFSSRSFRSVSNLPSGSARSKRDFARERSSFQSTIRKLKVQLARAEKSRDAAKSQTRHAKKKLEKVARDRNDLRAAVTNLKKQLSDQRIVLARASKAAARARPAKTRARVRKKTSVRSSAGSSSRRLETVEFLKSSLSSANSKTRACRRELKALKEECASLRKSEASLHEKVKAEREKRKTAERKATRLSEISTFARNNRNVSRAKPSKAARGGPKKRKPRKDSAAERSGTFAGDKASDSRSEDDHVADVAFERYRRLKSLYDKTYNTKS